MINDNGTDPLGCYARTTSLIYTLNRFENKTSPEIANELNLSCRTVENHLFLGRREMREFFRNCI